MRVSSGLAKIDRVDDCVKHAAITPPTQDKQLPSIPHN
jgi:hypothetical protein